MLLIGEISFFLLPMEVFDFERSRVNVGVKSSLKLKDKGHYYPYTKIVIKRCVFII